MTEQGGMSPWSVSGMENGIPYRNVAYVVNCRKIYDRSVGVAFVEQACEDKGKSYYGKMQQMHQGVAALGCLQNISYRECGVHMVK